MKSIHRRKKTVHWHTAHCQDNSLAAVDDALSLQRTKFVVRRVAYLEICRRGQKRSLLKVNEHFALKPDAADDALSQQRAVKLYN